MWIKIKTVIGLENKKASERDCDAHLSELDKLLFAALEGWGAKHEKIGGLLRQGANPNAFRVSDKTIPILLAKDAETLRLLLEAGADANGMNTWSVTPLHLAKTPEMVELLINAGATPNIADEMMGETALHGVSDLRSAELMLQAGGDPCRLTSRDQTAAEMMALAATNSDAEERAKIAYLFVQKGARLQDGVLEKACRKFRRAFQEIVAHHGEIHARTPESLMPNPVQADCDALNVVIRTLGGGIVQAAKSFPQRAATNNQSPTIPVDEHWKIAWIQLAQIFSSREARHALAKLLAADSPPEEPWLSVETLSEIIGLDEKSISIVIDELFYEQERLGAESVKYENGHPLSHLSALIHWLGSAKGRQCQLGGGIMEPAYLESPDDETEEERVERLARREWEDRQR